MIIDAFLTPKSTVPFMLYLARFFVEGAIVDRTIFSFRWFRKFSPDLCYMAIILSAFNIILDNTGLHSVANGWRYPGVLIGVYVLGCGICWIACMLYYEKTINVQSNTDRAILKKCRNGAVSFAAAFLLYTIAVYFQ